MPRNWVKVRASGGRKFFLGVFLCVCEWPTFAVWRLNVRTGHRAAQQDTSRSRRGRALQGKDTYPGTVVIEAIHAIVAQAAVRCTRWPEYFAGETILQLDRLPFDQHLLGAWWRSVCGAVQRVWHFYTHAYAASERFERKRK